MFARPRQKKSTLPPPSRKRKTVHAIEEISFDDAARSEYLTGFHKRKVERRKRAQEADAEKARLEKIEFRKTLREEQKQAVEDHVKRVNEMLRVVERAGQDESADEESEEEWGGIEDEEVQPLEPVDHEEEYIDEDRYTTVTVEAVEVDRHGFHKPGELGIDDSGGKKAPVEEEEKEEESTAKRKGKDGQDGPAKKKKKFRYESKFERQLTDRKQKASRRR